MESNYISYKDFQIDDLKFDDPLRHVIAHPQRYCAPEYYDVINLQYHTGGINMVGCEMITDGFIGEAKRFMYSLGDGILFHDLKDGYDTDLYTQMTLDINDPTCVKFIETIDSIYKACINSVYDNRQKLELSRFEYEHLKYIFMSPIIYPKDHNTGEILPDRNPVIYLRLSHDFYKNLVWKDLKQEATKSIIMKLIPTLHIRLIYSRPNHNCRLNISITGAELTDVEYIDNPHHSQSENHDDYEPHFIEIIPIKIP